MATPDLAQRAIDEAFVAYVHKLFDMMSVAYSEGQDIAVQRFARGFETALKAHEVASKMFGDGAKKA